MIKAFILCSLIASTLAEHDTKCRYKGRDFDDEETYLDPGRFKLKCKVNKHGWIMYAIACLTDSNKEVWPGEKLYDDERTWTCIRDGVWLKSVWEGS